MGPLAMASPGRTTQLGDKMLTSMEPTPFTRELATRRTEVPVIPTYIRQEGVEVDQRARTHIRRKLRTKLAKFAASVERASVRIGDLNGPRGGVDQVCRIKVVLSGLPSVVFEQRGATLEAVVDGALTGVERAVRRSVQRRRMAPTKGGRRGQPT
jgi:sigma 54 modulation/S30EA-like ribosomal protein